MDKGLEQCDKCDYFISVEEAYKQGRADGYSQAENDYHKQTEKDRQSSYDCGYEQGRADQKEEDNAFFNFEGAWELEKKKIRADAIDECIKVFKDIPRHYYREELLNELEQLKEGENNGKTRFNG